MLLYIVINCFAGCLAYKFVIHYDRLELGYYDQQLIDNGGSFLFGKYNRTNSALNVTFDLLQDLDGRLMSIALAGYQLRSNEYQLMGTFVVLNLCKYWKTNLYGDREYLKNFGNLEGCDIKKGHYYLYNFMPPSTMLQKLAIPGYFKLEVKVTWTGNHSRIFVLNWYLDSQLTVRNHVMGG